jgi:hypothetical protein
MKLIDVILTSYARWDLLEKTLDSFFSINTYPINNFIIHEDYGYENYTKSDWESLERLKNKYPKVIFYSPKERQGQINALDWLFSKVNTEYVLTLEDDWLCLKDGGIEGSIKLLEEHKKCSCVWLRGMEDKDVNYHPIIKKDGIFQFSTNYTWKGFSFGVGVKRLSDYNLIGSYSKHTTFNPKYPFISEKIIGELYFNLGYFASTLTYKYFEHIGDNRGIRN